MFIVPQSLNLATKLLIITKIENVIYGLLVILGTKFCNSNAAWLKHRVSVPQQLDAIQYELPKEKITQTKIHIILLLMSYEVSKTQNLNP